MKMNRFAAGGIRLLQQAVHWNGAKPAIKYDQMVGLTGVRTCRAVPSGWDAYGKFYPEKSSDGMERYYFRKEFLLQHRSSFPFFQGSSG
jgi:hypothetical protein